LIRGEGLPQAAHDGINPARCDGHLGRCRAVFVPAFAQPARRRGQIAKIDHVNRHAAKARVQHQVCRRLFPGGNKRIAQRLNVSIGRQPFDRRAAPAFQPGDHLGRQGVHCRIGHETGALREKATRLVESFPV